MNIGSWNIEGLIKYEQNGEFKEYLKRFDIFSLCETWGKNLSDFENFLEGYTAFTKVRKKRFLRGRYSGGVTVFVKNKLMQQGLIEISLPLKTV